MPRYRPTARARRGKNASLTCICARIVANYCPRTSAILDQGPIDTCNLEVQTSKLQSIHCGLPASWTRARRHPPSSPSPVASRGGGRALAFLNWTRVQLDLPLARREASCMGVYAQISSGADLFTDSSTHGSLSTEGMVRIPGGTFRLVLSGRGASRSSQGSEGGSHPCAPTIAAATARRAPRASSRYISHHVGLRCIIRAGSTS
jgi:hypothetical protein